MYVQVERPKENKSKAVANSVAQKKSNGKQSFGFVDNRPEAAKHQKMQNIIDNNIQLKAVLQRKTDHLFNDIPKTLRKLPAAFDRLGLVNIHQQLDTIRNKGGNKQDDVHAQGGADANSLRYGLASAAFIKTVENYGKGKVNEGHLRIATYRLWQESIDSAVAINLGATVNGDIAKWKELDRTTYQQLGRHF
jgi:hypothetical protein